MTDLNTFIKESIEIYNNSIKKLPETHKMLGGGKARNSSGEIFETFIKNICESRNLVALKNDYKRAEPINGVSLTNLQVDRHIYLDGVMIRAIESKCYLDTCYLKRAVMDFTELTKSPDVPQNVEYAILAGQECVSDNSLNYYRSYFKHKTNKDLNIFIINKHKKRNATRAIYMEQYNKDFEIDEQEVLKLVKWLQT